MAVLISLALAGSMINTSLFSSKDILSDSALVYESTTILENIVQNEDVLNACLLLAYDYYPDIDRVQTNRTFERIVDDIKMQTKDTRDPQQIVTSINEYIFDSLCIQPVSTGAISSILPNTVLENKKGNCLSISIIYTAIAEQLQLKIFPKIVPHHMFLSYDDGVNRFNIETTSDGFSFPDSHYVNYLPYPQQRPTSAYLRKLSKSELLGVFLLKLGTCLGQAGRNRDALNAQKRALRLFPELASVHINIGASYLKLGNIKQAKTHLIKAVTLEPTSWSAHSHLGHLYFIIANYKKSIETNDKAIELLYKSVKIRASVLELPEHKNLIDLAKGVLIKRDASLNELLGFGIVSFKEKEFQLARDLFERALKHSPDDPDIHSFQAITYLHIGKDTEAIKHSKIADEKYGYSPLYGATYFITNIANSYKEIGNAHGMLKDYKASIEAFNKVLNMMGPDAEIYTALGKTYSLAGDKKRAIYFYKQALELSPSYEDARKKLLEEMKSS
ncbi:MAG: tetratricopeptide repeat protein [Planctomycetota bacterium]